MRNTLRVCNMLPSRLLLGTEEPQTFKSDRLGRILELEFATDDLTLWRRILWVETVLLETFRANV